MVKELSSAEISSPNPFYLIINKRNRYVKESNRNKYLTLVPTDES